MKYMARILLFVNMLLSIQFILEARVGIFLSIFMYFICVLLGGLGLYIADRINIDRYLDSISPWNFTFFSISPWTIMKYVGCSYIMMILGLKLVGGIIGINLMPSETEKLQRDTVKYCNAEQIAKTGTKECELYQKKYSEALNKDLSLAKQNLQTAKSNVKTLQKDKEKSCSEEGLKAYGTSGCETATHAFERNEKSIAQSSKEIEEIENKLKELKTKK